LSSIYNHKTIESKWQKYWEENQTFITDDDFSKPKYYALDMFPYPSGAGLHVGHPLGYIATDIVARYKRMNGFNVLHPMGWDAFGLPAEQYAIQTGTHPAETTKKNIETFRRQIKMLGFSYDWSREINTTDPQYFKWTQWIFMQLYKKGLAYEAEVPVNWCPELGTVLANEEVIDGKSERGGYPVTRIPMRQWILKITDYAESLLDGLNNLDWPENIKELQRNWIGRSEGAEVIFDFSSIGENIKIFTTRPDTLFGATYMVLAPEHPLVDLLTGEEKRGEVKNYVEEASNKTDLDRTELTKEKSGIFLGSYAVNPVNNEQIPIWIADYVLMTYGTGAIMAVPGHDQRDWEFAKKYDLPIIEVVSGGEIEKEAFESYEGTIVNSQTPDSQFSINELNPLEAIKKITSWLEETGKGKFKINYKLRDWLFSRQRFWGEPFPVIHSEEGIYLVDENELPVELPELANYKPTGTGESPLANVEDWVNTTDKNGNPAKRETNTMPQWAGSCWYYLRYIDPNNDNNPWDKEKENYWLPVDLYVGGQEHAVLHLLYARFWHHVLFDLGLVSTKEPFQKLFNQGMIQGEDGQKMSKSKGNVVNPDEVVDEFGADSMRLFEMFMGPLEKSKPWSTMGIQGSHRFIKKIWKLFINENGDLTEKIKDNPMSKDLKRSLHQTIKKVTNDIETLKLNTAVSQLMIFFNQLKEEPELNKEAVKTFILLLNPIIPHVCEDIWNKLGNQQSIAYENWPDFDSALTKEELVKFAVQINGKLRGNFEIERDAPNDNVITLAKKIDNVKKYLEGNEIKKMIVVENRLVNFVI
tara:strand:- start:9725 stop:12160 length:2436 start_codon:yes stop_codon:yes gene_type:complete